MTIYQVQTLETAPERSRGAMLRLKNSAGMIPNLAAMMSTSPILIDAFVTLRPRGGLSLRVAPVPGPSAATPT